MNFQPSTQDKINIVLATVDGWLGEFEAALLSKYAALAKLPIIEIGSFRGRSTIVMALSTDQYVYAIDPHIKATSDPSVQFGNEDRVMLIHNLCIWKVQHKVKLVELSSHAAELAFKVNCTDFLFLDADHTYDAVHQDISMWLAKVKIGGHIAFHDSTRDSVQRAINEFSHCLELVEKADLTSIYKVLTHG